MRNVYGQARGNPGVRRMRAGLAALGHLVSHKRVHRLMQAAGLRGRHPRAWKRTTIGGDRPVTAPDLIGRDFTAPRPETRWCGDVTYIKTWDGWAISRPSSTFIHVRWSAGLSPRICGPA